MRTTARVVPTVCGKVERCGVEGVCVGMWKGVGVGDVCVDAKVWWLWMFGGVNHRCGQPQGLSLRCVGI